MYEFIRIKIINTYLSDGSCPEDGKKCHRAETKHVDWNRLLVATENKTGCFSIKKAGLFIPKNGHMLVLDGRLNF